MVGKLVKRKAPIQKMELVPKYEAELGLFNVRYKGAGKIPDELSGMYTTSVLAQIAIDNYILLRKRK